MNSVNGKPEIQKSTIKVNLKDSPIYHKVYRLYNGNTIRIKCDQYGLRSTKVYTKHFSNGVFMESGMYTNGHFIPDYNTKYFLKDLVLSIFFMCIISSLLIIFIRFNFVQYCKDFFREPYAEFESLSDAERRKKIKSVQCPYCSKKDNHKYCSEYKDEQWKISMLTFECVRCSREFRVRR